MAHQPVQKKQEEHAPFGHEAEGKMVHKEGALPLVPAAPPIQLMPEALPTPLIQQEEDPPRLKEETSGGMPPLVQSKMEHAFQTDFSEIDIHTNSSKATHLHAKALTQGNSIHFAPGAYQPNTTAGQQLLGHELTHVVQQQTANVQPTVQLKGEDINNDEQLEKEADEVGAKAAAGQQVVGLKHAGGTIQKKPGAIQAKMKLKYKGIAHLPPDEKKIPLYKSIAMGAQPTAYLIPGSEVKVYEEKTAKDPWEFVLGKIKIGKKEVPQYGYVNSHYILGETYPGPSPAEVAKRHKEMSTPVTAPTPSKPGKFSGSSGTTKTELGSGMTQYTIAKGWVKGKQWGTLSSLQMASGISYKTIKKKMKEVGVWDGKNLERFVHVGLGIVVKGGSIISIVTKKGGIGTYTPALPEKKKTPEKEKPSTEKSEKGAPTPLSDAELKSTTEAKKFREAEAVLYKLDDVFEIENKITEHLKHSDLRETKAQKKYFALWASKRKALTKHGLTQGDWYKLLQKYTNEFRSNALSHANKLLDNYEQILKYYKEGFEKKKMIDVLMGLNDVKSARKDDFRLGQINAALRKSTPVPGLQLGRSNPRKVKALEKEKGARLASRKKSLEALKKNNAFPFLRDANFPLARLTYANTSKEEAQKLVIAHLDDRIAAVKKTRETLKDDPDYLFTFDKLVERSANILGIDKGTHKGKYMFKHAEKIKSIKKMPADMLALLGMVLLLVPGGGFVGGAARVAAAGAGVAGATMEVKEYQRNMAAHKAGFLGESPSLAWVVLAVAAAGLDLHMAAKALKPLKDPLMKFGRALISSDPADKMVIKLGKKLHLEIGAQVAAGKIPKGTGTAVRQAVDAQISLRKAWENFVAEGATLNMGGKMPGKQVLVDLARALRKTGVDKVDDFAKAVKHRLKLKRALTSAEKTTMSDAFTEAIQKPKKASAASRKPPTPRTSIGNDVKLDVDDFAHLRSKHPKLKDMSDKQITELVKTRGSYLETLIDGRFKRHWATSGVAKRGVRFPLQRGKTLKGSIDQIAKHAPSRIIDRAPLGKSAHEFIESNAHLKKLAKAMETHPDKTVRKAWKKFYWGKATPGDGFALGKVGSKKIDLAEVFLDKGTMHVIDATQRWSGMIHNFKTQFYKEVFGTITNLKVTAIDFKTALKSTFFD